MAVDLLSIDGQPLFDVPLLERKRLLEAVIEQSELVRVSPVGAAAGPPVVQLVARAGLRGLIIKSTNSRYTPGRRNDRMGQRRADATRLTRRAASGRWSSAARGRKTRRPS